MWHDPARQLLVYDTKTPEAILAKVPGSVSLSNGYVAVPTTLYNLQLLRWLDYPVVDPMEGNYDWPGRHTPFASQRITSNFLCLNPRAFVLSDMGTGKTLAALWAADYVMRRYPGTRALVVAPLSTLQRVWGDEIFTSLLGRRTAVILHGSAEKRVELLAQPADFYIINHDGLAVGAPEDPKSNGRGLYAALLARDDIRIAIVDEASVYRDSSTRRHRVARKLLGRRDYLWMMTGTPTPNGPLDAYGLARLVNNAHGESFNSFKGRVMVKLTQFKWVPKAGAMAEARRLLRPAVRFAIEDCIDLPPCTTQQRDVPFSPAQKAAYDTLKKDLRLTLGTGKPITAVNEAVLRMKLIQISCGAIYGQDREINLVDAKPRLAALREVLAETDDKVIVFAPLTSVLHMLHKELKHEVACEVINGEVSQKTRSALFSAFQQKAAAPRVLLADPGTMAHGLTLTAATVIVWYAPTEKTELYLQANKRIDRPGQTKATTIVQLASTAAEREIYRRLAANETLQGSLMSMVRREE